MQRPINSFSDFDRVDSGGLRGVVHRDFAAKLGDLGALAAALEREPGKVLRKGGGQGITALCELPTGPAFLKIYPPGKLHRRLRDLVGEGRALREWRANCATQALGIETATVIAALTRRQGFGWTHFFLTAPAPGREAAGLLRADTTGRSDLLNALGRHVRSLHDRGFWHAHLHAKHLFVADDGMVTLIDMERSQIRNPLPEKLRERNLRQMRKSLGSLVTPAEVAIFDEAYGAGQK